ncbi:hypothetical protein HXX76_011901 [Chlamydomonas incerta]|uniref:Chloride channel protein n=1 Tax=Chlamydomonas incerta TaxID=51695 RepID=A0A835SNA1_CHLIN|nr:hypothetical protein HXX76_011901 [Chlamydomonas incerta]|eukprot:KAG2428222.1 hypothetical protein HXX76_011901 [Chlamydomonas incerta]
MTTRGEDRLLFQDMREYARFQGTGAGRGGGGGGGGGGGHDLDDVDDASDPLLGPGGAARRRSDVEGFAGGAGLLLGGGAGDDADDYVPWRRAWRSIFKKGNDVESARVNHSFTPTERAKLANVESIDYLAPNSATYRKWLARQPHRRSWDRWVMMGSIGVATGLVAHGLYVLISFFAGFKYGVTRWLLGHTNVGVAWLFNVIVSVGLVAASSAVVIGWAPEAQGSGVPEVMAYLNGCMLPKLFNVATLGVKWLSCGLVVASGLPVGPEGPLIHIGAAIGAALSQGHSTTLGFTTQLFRRFRNPKDKRDFVTAGVSVGVAAAFNAPIGGLLFAFEEVASFWQQRLGWQVFYACMCAVLTLNLSRSAGKALLGQGSFGWFDKEVAFEQIGMSFSSHVLAVAPAAVIGLCAGLLAVIFTVANIKVTRLRAMLTGHLKWKRAIEPCVLAAVYITGVMALPLFFPCTPAECVIDDAGEMQCSTGLSGPGQGIPDMAPSLPLYTCRVIEHVTPNFTNVPAFPPSPSFPGAPSPPFAAAPSFPPPPQPDTAAFAPAFPPGLPPPPPAPTVPVDAFATPPLEPPLAPPPPVAPPSPPVAPPPPTAPPANPSPPAAPAPPPGLPPGHHRRVLLAAAAADITGNYFGTTASAGAGTDQPFMSASGAAAAAATAAAKPLGGARRYRAVPVGQGLGCGPQSHTFSNWGSQLGRRLSESLLLQPLQPLQRGPHHDQGGDPRRRAALGRADGVAGAVSNDGSSSGAAGAGGSRAWLPRGIPTGGGGSITPNDDDRRGGGGGNGTSTVYYNQLATLLFSTGEEGIKHLFARGTHRLFGYRALITLGCYYFVFAVLVAGSAVASGLFVPMLMIGAVLGRIFGLLTVDIAQGLGKRWSVDTLGPWAWIDPGVFALVGAGAFMGGVTRMTVALAVIMIEVSSDVHMLLPVLVAIMTAKWVADAACHSLYHGLLEVKCVPFLPCEPVSAFSLDLLPVSHVMASPVVCLRQRMTIREITDVLRRCKHNGFPVLRDGPGPGPGTGSAAGGAGSAGSGATPPLVPGPAGLVGPASAVFGPLGGGGGSRRAGAAGGAGAAAGASGGVPGTCCGLITRQHLMVLLQKAVLAGRSDGLEVDWTELNRKMMDPVAAARSVHQQQMAVLAREMAAADPGLGLGSPLNSDSGLAALGLLRAAAAARGGSGGGAAAATPSLSPAASAAAGLLSSLGLAGRAGSGSHGAYSALPGGSGRGDSGGAAAGGAGRSLEPAGAGGGGGGPLFAGDGYDYGGVGVLPSMAAPGPAAAGGAQAAPPPLPPKGPGLQGPAVAARTPAAQNGDRLRFGDEAPPPPTSTAASDGAAARYGVGRGGGGGGGGDLESGVIDLTPYINTSAFVVPDSFSVERTYVLFRTMGLRHLTVVDETYSVKGMVTRKDLLGYRLDDALARALNGPSGSGSHHSRHVYGGGSGRLSFGAGAASSAHAGNGAAAGAAAGAAGAGAGMRVLAGRPGVTGGPTALHPTTAGMRNLLVSGNVPRLG